MTFRRTMWCSWCIAAVLMPLARPVPAHAQSTPAPDRPRVSFRPQAAAAQGTSSITSDKLHISVAFMAAFGHDAANAPLGFEKQGRVGYAIIGLSGRLTPRITYKIGINPVNEVAPLPACGEATFFYPNAPNELWNAGPVVPCDVKQGNRRVDMYRGIANDTVDQQGALREASVTFEVTPSLHTTFGRFPLSKGFGVEEAGSFTAKDATMIQRINAESNFGLQLTYAFERDARRWLTLNAAGVLGEGNRWQDYDYFYFQDGSLDANSALTFFASAAYTPDDKLDVRASIKAGFTGSKVERLPSYWASKRNDHAVVISGQYKVLPRVRVMGEVARYTWGPTRTSAEMLGVDPEPIHKSGYWVGAEATHPIRDGLVVGSSVTREEIDRADSLIRILAANNLFGVVEGKKDRMTVIRLFFDLHDRVRLGYYFNAVSNPYPWVSGIYPVEGPQAFQGRGLDRWGLVVRFRAEY